MLDLGFVWGSFQVSYVGFILVFFQSDLVEVVVNGTIECKLRKTYLRHAPRAYFGTVSAQTCPAQVLGDIYHIYVYDIYIYISY